MKKFIFLIITGCILFVTKDLKAQCDERCELNNKINEYTQKITQLQGQANTLTNQIASYNAQISLTEAKIQQTEEQIDLLANRIDQVQGSLDDLQKAFSARAVATYKMSRTNEPAYLVLTSDDLTDAISKYHYLKEAEDSDRELLGRLQSAQDSYIDSKNESEKLQKQLNTQQVNLNAQKASKAKLLADTKGNESNYQRLLSEAKAQLSQLAGFAESVGADLIPHQELSDGWGKYYNQRDSDWGGIVINNSGYSVSAVGCLLTSVAMVSTHFGGSITPREVVLDSSNFWPGTALLNKPGPAANGHSAQDVDNPYLQNNQNLKDALNSGASVIAGLSKDGGPYPSHYSDHWVVLRSVDGDSFRINDPLYAGAMDVLLNDHYAGWTIIQAKIYR